MGSRRVARSVSSPQQHRTPMKEPVPVERGTNRLDQMLNKCVLTGPVWAHDSDKKTGRLRPSPNEPYDIGKQVHYQPQRISHKTCSPRLRLNLREERVQATAVARLDNAYLKCAQEKFTG